MLWDPKKDKQVKADPFSLDTLIAWLETKNPDEQYCYMDSGRCLLSRYFIAQGFKNVRVYPEAFLHGDVAKDLPLHITLDTIDQIGTPLPVGFDWIARGSHQFDYLSDHSFGGALERARAVADAR